MENIEIINGVPVDWNKFKGSNLARSKKAYVDFCELLHKNGHRLLSEYKNVSSKVIIDFSCGHDPHEITPEKYKLGVRCPKCSGNCSEQAKEDLINLINKNGHRLLSEYKSAKEEVLIDFNCGHDPHLTTPDRYKRGKRCPKCSNRCPEQAKEDFMELLNKNGHRLLSEYKGIHDKVLIDFNCGHSSHWIQPSDYKIGRRCPRCSGRGGQAKEDFMELLNKNGHRLLSEYVNERTKVLIDFNCGHSSHRIRPNDYKSGKRCPHCKNKGEGALHNLLIDMGYEVKSQHKYEDLKDKNYLKYDFYLPEYNLLIELDGEHHREEIYYKSKNDITDMDEVDAYLKLCDRQRKDKLKDDYAKDNNIPLLRIEYNRKIELDKWKQLILDKINEIETKVA